MNILNQQADGQPTEPTTAPTEPTQPEAPAQA